jgi:hypothetical protein
MCMVVVGDGHLDGAAAEGLWALSIWTGGVIVKMRFITVVRSTAMKTCMVWHRARVRIVINLIAILDTASAATGN